VSGDAMREKNRNNRILLLYSTFHKDPHEMGENVLMVARKAVQRK
jgi:hypothetical protein